MIASLHPAEQCLNELSKHDKPWSTPECLEIIKRHMAAAFEADLTEEAAALRDEVELKQTCISGMREQADKIATELDSTQQWYAVRFERLKDLARTLPEPVQYEFFSILANGTANATEPPSYSLQMNALRHERDRLHDHAQRADDFEIILRRLVHLTRDVADSRVISTRQKADELLRRKGTSSALRVDDLGNPCESECPACVGCKAKEPSARLAAENHQLYKQDYAFPPSCFSPDGQTWRQLAEMQAIRLAQSADADRVINWIRNSAKRAVTAFTEGPERQIAYAVEDDRLRNRANQQTLKGNAE